jgi:hypothetical protein
MLLGADEPYADHDSGGGLGVDRWCLQGGVKLDSPCEMGRVCRMLAVGLCRTVGLPARGLGYSQPPAPIWLTRWNGIKRAAQTAPGRKEVAAGTAPKKRHSSSRLPPGTQHQFATRISRYLAS